MMTPDGYLPNQRDCRQALEGLRNGVPNGEAVKLLGCNQFNAEAQFKQLLAESTAFDREDGHSLGMLISGSFGSGKSHLLSYLEHVALEKGFVCSRVPVSKETPLFDMSKVFKSAMLHARMPDRTGNLMEEIGLRMNDRGSQTYQDFSRWANSPDNTELHPIFPASLMVHERLNDPEYNVDIEAFWGGDSIAVSRVRQGMREISQQGSFSFRAPRAADLPPQRLRFATELIKGSGYAGWVVLLDEIELVGSYSALQRGRSYAELARWLGKVESEVYPGLVAVGSVTEGFSAEILSEFGRNDSQEAPSRLLSRFGEEAVARCEAGIRQLEREALPLDLASPEDLERTAAKLREIYRVAYDWEPPPINMTRSGAGYQNRMRYKIRAAVNEWDLKRLYPNAQPETEGQEFSPSFEEQTELEQESQDEPSLAG